MWRSTSLIKKEHVIRLLGRNTSYISTNGRMFFSEQRFMVVVAKNPRNSSLLRMFSSSSNDMKDNKKSKIEEKLNDEEQKQEIMLTPGEKVAAGSRMLLWSGILGFACVCAYYVIKELLPTKMSPNSVFDKAFDVVRSNSEVNRLLGPPLKAYGRDHGGHREGRRNFIEHKQYYDENDSSDYRTRIRFNLEGKFGTAFVFVEVSSKMKSGEFVYILVQDKRNGHVLNIIDNRSALVAARQFSSPDQGVPQAITNLLSGSKSGK